MGRYAPIRPRLFAEFPAGLAAVSLRLQGGAHCRPPISRMGNKAGFSQTILGVLGLHSGQGAGAYWWAEADPDVAALLRIYPDPDALREVARIIRGWAGEEPRALWERLRAERRARGAAAGTVGEVAGWLFVAGGSMMGAGDAPFGGNLEGWENGAHGDGTSKRPLLARLPDAADRLAEVAETVILQKWSFSERGWEHGYGGPGCEVRTAPGGWTTENRDAAIGIDAINNKITNLSIRSWPPVRVSPCIPSAAEVAAAIGTPGDLSGCVVYMDPPYAGTTGYTADLPRAEVVAHARDFASLGATVAISEAVAIPELMQAGWHHAEITGGRVGAKRTFSRQQQEIITMNKPPAYAVPVQVEMYRTHAPITTLMQGTEP